MISTDTGTSRLIFALDTAGGMDETLHWVDLLKDHVGMFKVGKESFTAFGPALVTEILARGGRVFLDLKYHDIPNTVEQAGRAATRLGVHMFNVHALGGLEMMRRTVRGVVEEAEACQASPPIMLAVTVLTSLSEQDLHDIGFSVPSVSSLVVSLARQAQDAGMHGVVASPREVAQIRAACGKDFTIVTPGIRAHTLPGDDQKRTRGPRETIAEGADYIVVGRPIRTADDPVAAARTIAGEIESGLKHRDTSHMSRNIIPVGG